MPRRLALSTLSLILAAVLLPAVGYADSDSDSDSDARTWRRPLLPSTGFNDLCGAPVFEGAPNFSFSALFNDAGGDPIPLTPELCADNPDALLASWANPGFYAANGFPLPDPRLLNVPYHRTPIVVDPSGLRAFVPDHVPGVPQPVPPTRSLPNPIETVGSFLAVGGSMELECRPDGTARVEIEGDGYPENSVLTLWVIWANDPSSGLPPVLPQPLGGVPNTVVADEDGEFEFERELNFCPMEVQPGGSVPLAIDVAKHLDGNSYGGVPELPLAVLSFVDPTDGTVFTTQGVGAGMMTVDQGVIALLIDP